MNTLLLLLPPLVPLLMALVAHRLQSRWWLLCAALPAFYVGLMVEEGSNLDMPWLLLGMHFMLDTTGRLFLTFGSLIWLLAALFIPRSELVPGATGYRKQSFLLAMTGNLMLILAADMLTFYVGFALMGLSAYGLVWGPSQRARQAARVYLVFTLIGELAIFAALLFLRANAGSLLFEDLHVNPTPPIALALLLLGFGIKVALPGLHLWLPRTYTLAPVFGVAVLSGPMIKAGLLGWLRFLPFGTPVEPMWGDGLMLLGMLGITLGLVIGMVQREPRAVLAYSSIAKMGLFSALIGFTLNHPVLAGGLLPVIVMVALHHLLVKPMLFMGLDLWQRRASGSWLLPALILLALSLAAFPLTGGGAAKSALSTALGVNLSWLLWLSGIAAVVLMSRFLWLLQRRTRSTRSDPVTLMGWFLLLPAAAWAPFAWDEISFEPKALVPLAAGLSLFVLGMVSRQWLVSLLQLIRPLERLTKRRFSPALRDRFDVRSTLHQLWIAFKPAVRLPWPGHNSRFNGAVRDHTVWWLFFTLMLLGALTL